MANIDEYFLLQVYDMLGEDDDEYRRLPPWFLPRHDNVELNFPERSSSSFSAMALVMLPCDLPWWTSVQRHLKHLLLASSSAKLAASMLKIHEMCNIGLDPDDDVRDPELMKGLEMFLNEELNTEELQQFLDNTVRVMVQRALHLKRWRPPKGLMFSLQQQSDVTELSYKFVSSLVAHAFFSTFPKRTLKTHPTLQDFNFTNFFKYLHRKSQRSKLKSLLHYFEWLDKNNNDEGSIKIHRQVMSSKQWLTIEDWLECTLPLCKFIIRHEGRPDRCESDDAILICFASSRIGGEALSDGDSQECLSMFMMPELLAAMLSVEALEDNEVVKIEGVRMSSRISDKKKANLELLNEPKKVTICMMDAEDYSALPLSQWEEDNVLRELNKSLLAFQQTPAKIEDKRHERRLSPIGESFSHPEVEATVVLKQASSCSTINSYNSRSPSPQNYSAAVANLHDPSVELSKRKCWLSPGSATLNNRRGRFIVLGSSGECLPVTRSPDALALPQQEDSLYSSCNSSDDEYHSANDSFDYAGSEDEGRGESARPNSFGYSKELSTEERRLSFAGRLREALRREAEESCTTSTGDWSTDSSSYAVGISISGAEVNDNDIRVKRGGSVGFVLTDRETMSNGAALSPRKRHIGKKETGNSSKYSFSTEYTSELEEVYEQFNQWLNDPIIDAESGEHKQRELDQRDLAVIRFAGSLLKRTLSESCTGASAGCAAGAADAAELYGRDPRDRPSPRRLVLAARSLSLELARHRHRLAAHLKRKVKDSIPEEILDRVRHSEPESKNQPSADGEPSSDNKSTDTCQSQIRKKKLNWVINMIVETIEETIECEPVTIKLQKPKLKQLAHKIAGGGWCAPVATGNWGCGRRQRGEPQLKLLLQWLAASVAGLPALIYYTCGNEQLYKLDTVVRVLVDRKWSVGQLTQAVLVYARQRLHAPHAADSHSLFDELIGIEKVPDD